MYGQNVLISRSVFVCLLIWAMSLVDTSVRANPVTTYRKSLPDSPQHVIKTANYRNSVAEVSTTTPPEFPAQSRMGKSEEAVQHNNGDGQLMYVVIKPAPKPVAPKKYRSESRSIYMDGVRNNSTANNERTPRLNMASGAYPVFYSIATANGKFGRNIRALTKEEISRAGKSMKVQ